MFSKHNISEIKQYATNKNIIICKTDKGRGQVLLDKETYIAKMIYIIFNETKFEKLSSPVIYCSLKIQEKVNNFLRKFKDEGSSYQMVNQKSMKLIFHQNSSLDVYFNLFHRFFLTICLILGLSPPPKTPDSPRVPHCRFL